MKLSQRLAYYGGGFAIGLVLLFFFLGGKKTSCDYGMDARVLKNIRTKEKHYNDNVLSYLKNNKIDTSEISKILKTGDVDFSTSTPRTAPCGIYIIFSKEHELKVENCDSIASFIAMKPRK